ncbi:MAG TPA: hypothetical protein VJG32_14905 [Anaerolineae bacterium]|nr:hypothetical protein [Anaerolineae bacterium]
MKKRTLTVLSVLVLIALLVAPAAAQESIDGLIPGQPIEFRQTIPINLVFVGYDPASIDQDALLAQLPPTYKPIVRYPPFYYGLPGRDLGLRYDFRYRVQFAGVEFEDSFFSYLQQNGAPGDPTSVQLDYNNQTHNVLEVTGPVLYVDAPSTERWLLNRAGSLLGIDTRRSYTIFFINWQGRDDFRFHVYTKTDEPDPDTGYNFGELRATRKLIAWGGSHGRTWFYDLSAGPEANSSNWNVDDADVDGDGLADYRLPPIWEYVTGGYRDPTQLSADLGKVTRFVGINLLFTTSPLYDPLVTTPGLAGRKIAHLEMFQDDPAANGLDWIRPNYILNQLSQFQPYYDWRVRLEDNQPIDPGAQRAFRIFTNLLNESDCWNAFGTTFAELFCYFDANRSAYLPADDPVNYVIPVFAFNATDANMGNLFGLLGYADDNWVDGTQSFVFAFDSPTVRDLGYGFSDTIVREVGRHLGLPSPHEGYDSELGLDYGPAGDTYFAWSGDESDTVMQYLALSHRFGQFDQDNLYRWETAGYLNWANGLLDDILFHPDVYSVRQYLFGAASQGVLALHHFWSWQYLESAQHAYQAYVLLATAAQQLGIPTPSAAAQRLAVLPARHTPGQVDLIRFPDN